MTGNTESRGWVEHLRPGTELTNAVQAKLPSKHVIDEVACTDAYLWMALVDGHGVLGAHRALLANGCAYLRAAFAFSQEVGLTAYRLARAIISRAEQSGFDRAHVWVETRGLERNLAQLLGVVQSTTPLHRYRLPKAAYLRLSHVRRQTDADLWVRDHRCLVSHPPFAADGLPGLPASDILGMPAADLLGDIDEIEIALPASDINAALDLRSRGAKRMSRVPVVHGIVNLGSGS